MRFAIVESGGKQYRAVEGRTIEVDRLPVDAGKKFDFERILLMADDDDVIIGTPVVSGIEVKVTVVDHVKGPKIDRFKYRPKKRIRVRGGHRQQFTRLLVDFIGRPGEERKVEKPEAQKEAEVEVIEKKPKEEKQAKAKKAAPTSTKKAPAKSATTKKSTTTKSSSKKTDSKKK
jgi:large subunit ribosomal protein L21